MNTAQNDYKAVRKMLRFYKLPIQEKNRLGELVLLTSDKAGRDRFYELTIINRNGNSHISRIYESGRREILHGNWMRVTNSNKKIVRILHKMNNGELVQMELTGNQIVTHRFKSVYTPFEERFKTILKPFTKK